MESDLSLVDVYTPRSRELVVDVRTHPSLTSGTVCGLWRTTQCLDEFDY